MPKASKQAGGTRKKRDGKKKKDPNAPKRGLSAYMFFANEKRDEVRSENPNISFGQVGKMLGEKWKALSASEREPFEQKAKADKERYDAEKASYAAGGDDDEEDD